MPLPQSMIDKKRKYTEKQQSFLDAMYDSKTGDVRQAMLVAGYEASSPVMFLIQSLSSELIEIASHTLAMNAPRAANKIVDIMVSNEPIPQVNQKLQAAQTLLDRVGVVKEQKMNVEHNVSGGIFVIPAKEELIIDEVEYVVTD